MSTPITLDHEGRYIQGPTKGKAEWLIREHGAKRLHQKPRGFPPRIDQIVAVIDRRSFEAALWITDPADFDDAAEMAADGTKIIWLKVPNAPLLEAEHEPEPRYRPAVVTATPARRMSRSVF